MPTAELESQLRGVLEPLYGSGLDVEGLSRLSGGASRETWSFLVRPPRAAPVSLVLRRDPPGSSAGPGGSGVRLETSLLRAAARAGVPVPEVVASGDASSGLGSGFVITSHVPGETIPRRILREPSLELARAGLARRCGEVLAAIHRIPPAQVPGLPDGDPLEQLRGVLDGSGQPHPAFELAMRWLHANRPPPGARGVVHGDFRNGNLIVGSDGLRAVLDWELAHVGDPVEDLGWLCAKPWRFGSQLPVGGFGRLEDLLDAYQRAGGAAVGLNTLEWWEIFATLRWGIICIVQAAAHLSGARRSVELAAIGRRVCEVEWDLLELLDGPSAASPRATESCHVTASSGAFGPGGASASPPHDAPGAGELLDAVGEFLETDVLAASEGRLRFHARVAANVVRMVARELALGPSQQRAHRVRLERLGFDSEQALAQAIRTGATDNRHDEVVEVVRATVADKLAVANPRYSGCGTEGSG